MADEIIYRYCLACKKRFKHNGEDTQNCTICGGLLSDSPRSRVDSGTEVKPKPQPQPTVVPRRSNRPDNRQTSQVSRVDPEPVQKPVEPMPKEQRQTVEFSGNRIEAKGVIGSLFFMTLSGIPFIGLIVVLISLFSGWLSSYISKSTKVALLISNFLGILVFIIFAGSQLSSLFGGTPAPM